MKKRVNKFFYFGMLAFVLASLLVMGPPPKHSHADGAGKLIVISLSEQTLYAYEDGEEVFETAITSGQPALPTPTGNFSIFYKQSPMTFYSPWGKSSPYYYPPTTVSYAMEFAGGGYFIHDAPWRNEFGEGTNSEHYDEESDKTVTGSHGCVNMAVDDAGWLYNWAPVGTPVQITE